jgi:hypothetical protein
MKTRNSLAREASSSTFRSRAQKKGAAEKLQVFIDKRKASPQIEIGERAPGGPRPLSAGDPAVPDGFAGRGVAPPAGQPRTGGRVAFNHLAHDQLR